MARRGNSNSSVFQTTETIRADYDMAKSSRLRRRRKVPASGSHADYHYRTEGDFLKCMEYSRDVVRNDMIAGSMVDRADDNTVQDGFKLDFQTGDKKLDRDLNARWLSWSTTAEECDLAQELTFPDMESMAFQAALVDGDISAVGTDDGCLQWYEGHLNRTPRGVPDNVVHGVELLPGRVKESYYFAKEELSPMCALRSVPDVSGFTNVKTRDEDGLRRVFQVYLRGVKRFSQTRGLTAFAPMFDLYGMHDDAQFNAILKQQLANAIVFMKSRTAEYEGGGGDSAIGSKTTQTNDDGNEEAVERAMPATFVKSAKGENLSVFSSSVPGPEFFPHVKMILTLLGINLGLPLILVLMDASETNFSGWRGAYEQAKMGFRKNQSKLIRRFHNPCVDWKVSQFSKDDPAVARAVERQIRRIGELRRIWHTPTWPYIQPLDDRNADLIAVANYQDSPSGIAAKNGQDYETVGERCIADRGMMIRRAKVEAKAINDEFPEDEIKVNWTQIYLPPTPAHVSASQPMSDSKSVPAVKPDKSGVNGNA